MKRINVVVSGRIQNVGYRAKVIAIAKAFGVTGLIQNLDDGRVRIIAESEDDNLDKFLDVIRIKNTLIDVEDVQVEHADDTVGFADFYKLVGGGETDERLDKAAEYLLKLISVMEAGFGTLKAETTKSIEQISTLRQETMKFGKDIGAMRVDLVGEVEEQISGKAHNIAYIKRLNTSFTPQVQFRLNTSFTSPIYNRTSNSFTPSPIRYS
uniref:acylphosphatase n=1 Tax=Candidatus Methanogaster sp. ANME-2c ERB4 TaxID=2759911 RepID=A0A7G9YJM6_9EURY|nr:acylphosphatase [Methanosarcinales archaeon ANME-2c ERB4]